MMNILYEIGDKLYINLTNHCPCDCVFCIRQTGDGAYGSDSLWLERDATSEEVINALSQKDLDSYSEIIYCGFGEPTEALDMLIDSAKFIKSKTKTPLRLNTNGLSDLINKKPTARLLEGLIDFVSVSLNAPDAQSYNKTTRPKFSQGDDKTAFEAMISFATECKKFIPKVMFTVVDVITKDEIERSKKLCKELGIELRVRKYDS